VGIVHVRHGLGKVDDALAINHAGPKVQMPKSDIGLPIRQTREDCHKFAYSLEAASQ
jgi:hypothetical protein